MLLVKRLLGVLLIALFVALSIIAIQSGDHYFQSHVRWDVVDPYWYVGWLGDHIAFLMFKIISLLVVVLLVPGLWLVARSTRRRGH